MGFNNLLKKIEYSQKQYPFFKPNKNATYWIEESLERHIFVFEYYLLQLSEMKAKDPVEHNKIQETIDEVHRYLTELLTGSNEIPVIAAKAGIQKVSIENTKSKIDITIARIKEKQAKNCDDMLIEAIENNDDELLEASLAAGANVNKVHKDRPPLIYAIYEKNLLMAIKLIKANADLNGVFKGPSLNTPITPLIAAIIENDIEMVKLLIASGVEVNVEIRENLGNWYRSLSPLSVALNNMTDDNQIDGRIVEALIKTGKIKKVKNHFKNAIFAGIDAVRLMLDAGYVVTKGVLKEAIQYAEDANIIDLLIIQENVDIQVIKESFKSWDGYTDLMFYTAIGDVTTVERLLTRPMHEISDIEAEFKDRQNALMIAARLGRTDVIPLLLNAGVDINLADKSGKTPLMCAAENNHKNTVEFLLELHADVNKQTPRTKQTALFLATENHHAEVVELLLKVDNIDITIQANYGGTANDIGLKSSNKEIVDAYKLKNAKLSIAALEAEVQKQIKHFRDNAKSCCFDFGNNNKKADKIEKALDRAKQSKSAQFSMHKFLSYHEKENNGKEKKSIIDALSYDRICFFGKPQSRKQIEDFVNAQKFRRCFSA